MARSFYDAMVYSMSGHNNDGTVTQTGAQLRNNYTGAQVRFPSFASIERAMQNQNSNFQNKVARVVPWLLAYATTSHPDGDGGPSGNYCLEARRHSTAVLKSNDQWEWFYQNLRPLGKRVYGSNDNSGVNGLSIARDSAGVYVRPHGNYGFELWPYPSQEYPGAEDFFGNTNRNLMAQGKAWMSCVQVRVGLIDSNGTDDRSSAKYLCQLGQDLYTNPQTSRYISTSGVLNDGSGYPYGVADGDFTSWFAPTTEWEWLVVVGAQDFWRHEADLPPPWGSYDGTKISWNKAPYALTRQALLANPPPEPDPLTGSPPPGPAPAPVPAPTPPPAPTVVDAKYRTKPVGVNWYNTGTGGVVSAEITSVEFTGTAYTLDNISDTYQLVWTVNVVGTPDESVTFSSSNSATASVSSTGLVTAVASGPAVITIRSVTDPTKTDTFDIQVGALSVLPPTLNPIGTGPSPRTISGSANVFASVSVYVDSVFIGSTNADAAGIWTYTLTGLADATYSVTATQTSGGTTSELSSALSMVVLSDEIDGAEYYKVVHKWLMKIIRTRWKRAN
jgi:hypothetical protein